MRHKRGYRKLNKATDQRIAMLRSITCALFQRGRIRVIETRAKEARRMVEKVISLAKCGDLSSRRRAISVISNADIVKNLFADAKTRFASRSGGYTRMVKIGARLGDAAPVVLLELI